MKVIVILAAVVAAVCAQNITGNSTSTGNITSTGNFTSTGLTGNGTSTGNFTSGATSGSSGNTTTSSSSSASTSTDHVSTSTDHVSTTDSTSTSSAGTTGQTGIRVDSTLYRNISDSGVCSNAEATFTSTIVAGVCSAYEIPNLSVSVIVHFFDGNRANLTLFLQGGCLGNPVVTNETFENNVCRLLTIPLPGGGSTTFLVNNQWSATSTTSSSTTGDTNAASSMVPSFLAVAFSTLFLLARSF